MLQVQSSHTHYRDKSSQKSQTVSDYALLCGTFADLDVGTSDMNFNIEALTNPFPQTLASPLITPPPPNTLRICLLEPSQSQESQLWDIPQSTSQLTYKTTISPFKCLPTFLIQHATFLLLRPSNKPLKILDQFSCVNRFFFRPFMVNYVFAVVEYGGGCGGPSRSSSSSSSFERL